MWSGAFYRVSNRVFQLAEDEHIPLRVRAGGEFKLVLPWERAEGPGLGRLGAHIFEDAEEELD